MSLCDHREDGVCHVDEPAEVVCGNQAKGFRGAVFTREMAKPDGVLGRDNPKMGPSTSDTLEVVEHGIEGFAFAPAGLKPSSVPLS